MAAPLPKYVICKNRKIARTIRVTKSDAGECVTVYTKAGIDRIVGTAKTSNACFNVFDNIKGNLERASWKCKDISSAQVETSTLQE